MKKDHQAIINNLINTVKSAIPKDIKAVDYLMDLLSLGREAVYRRLRGED